jgi:WD40 repeat protein
MWTAGLDSTAVEWDIAGDRSLRQEFDTRSPEDPDNLPFVAFTPDGRQIAVTGADHRTHFFDATTLEHTGALPKGSVECCMPPAFSNDGRLLATVDGTGVDLWDPVGRSLIRRLYTSTTPADPEGPPPVDAVAISPDGSVVAANDGDAVLLLDAQTGKVERRLDAGWYVAALTFSADGDLLAAAGGDPGGAQWSTAWDRRTGTRLWVRGVPAQSSLASFSADGKFYAVGNSDGQVIVLGARSGRPVGTPFVGDAGYVFSVSFDPRRGILAVTGTDGVVTLADPVTGATFGSPLVSPSPAWSTGAWSPDGSTYVLVGNNGIGNVWDMSPRDWVRRACQTAGRSLTRREWSQFLPDRPYDPAC